MTKLKYSDEIRLVINYSNKNKKLNCIELNQLIASSSSNIQELEEKIHKITLKSRVVKFYNKIYQNIKAIFE